MPAALTIEVLAAPVVNHAMAHNGLPFLHRIVVVVSGTGRGPDRSHDHGPGGGRVRRRPQPALAAPRRTGARPAPPWSSTSRRCGSTRRTWPRSRRRPAAEIVVEVTRPAEPAVALPPTRSGCWPRGSGRSTRRPRCCRWSCWPRSSSPTTPPLAPLVVRGRRRSWPTVDRQRLAWPGRPRRRRTDRRRSSTRSSRPSTTGRSSTPSRRPAGATARRSGLPATCSTERVGTCLDTTVLLAVGAGARRASPRCSGSRTGTPSSATGGAASGACPTPPAPRSRSPANAVDLELMGVAGDDPGHPGAAAAARPGPPGPAGAQGRLLPRRLRASCSGVVDVGMARMLRVYPLPARRARRRRSRRGGRVRAAGPRCGAVDRRHRATPEPSPAPRAAHGADRAGATAGPGLEERPARPDPAQQAAQPAPAR